MEKHVIVFSIYSQHFSIEQFFEDSQMSIEQLVAGKSVAQINDMADKLERIADAKAAAAAKAKAKAATAVAKANTAGAKAAQVKVAANSKAIGAAKASAATAGTAATGKSSAGMIGACCSSKSWTLGLGLGLGPWGPVLLAAGGATAAWYTYKNRDYLKDFFKEKFNFGREADAPPAQATPESPPAVTGGSDKEET